MTLLSDIFFIITSGIKIAFWPSFQKYISCVPPTPPMYIFLETRPEGNFNAACYDEKKCRLTELWPLKGTFEQFPPSSVKLNFVAHYKHTALKFLSNYMLRRSENTNMK